MLLWKFKLLHMSFMHRSDGGSCGGGSIGGGSDDSGGCGDHGGVVHHIQFVDPGDPGSVLQGLVS